MHVKVILRCIHVKVIVKVTEKMIKKVIMNNYDCESVMIILILCDH